MAEELTDLNKVTDRFPEARQFPKEDVVARGVALKAVDDFVEEVVMRGLVEGFEPMKTMAMVAYSCFHMGMLTEEYLVEARAAMEEEKARKESAEWLESIVQKAVQMARDKGATDEEIAEFLERHERFKEARQV